MSRLLSLRRKLVPSALALSGLCFTSVGYADWLQYRGPTQNGVSTEKGINPAAASPLKVLWRVSLGKGISSVVVQNGRAYTAGNIEGNDLLYCLDAKSGKEIWKASYPMALDPKLFEGGPRATPSLDGNRVYLVSQQGDLQSFDAQNGRKLWSRNLAQEFGGRRPDWGYAGSVLVRDDLLICEPGGEGASTVALNKISGKVTWKSGSDESGYATPIIATLEGKSVVVAFKAQALVGCDLRTGKELWRYPWKTDYKINAATPLPLPGGKILVTSGYNTGCALLQLSGNGPAEIWRNKNLRFQINSPVYAAGHIFGIDGNVGGGNLVCLDPANGQRAWDEKSVKGGALISADGKLLVLTEKGELVIGEATAAAFRLLSRGKALSQRCWAQPTLDDGRLFLRSNEGELVCVEAGSR